MTQHEIVVDTQKETVSYLSVQVDDVRSLIMCVMDHTGWQKVLNCEVDRIVVGRDLYMKILQSKLERPFCVISEVPLRNGTTGTKICGIDVQFVPWIEGFAIIPKKDV
ncbi:MAG: hypothetical protein E6Q97_09680 [Desulfurellales bacterium]|nr:MAG: hypothetical protein E6Q97_09680 [Desulfurellales bacterium]